MSSRKHPKWYDVVLQALTKLGDVKGSSVSNIIDLVRCAINDHNVIPRPRKVTTLVRNSLRHGIQMGHLEQRSGRYKIRVNSSCPIPKRNTFTKPPHVFKAATSKKQVNRKKEEDVSSRSSMSSRSRSESSTEKKLDPKNKQEPKNKPEPEENLEPARYQTRSRTAHQRTLIEATTKAPPKKAISVRKTKKKLINRTDNLKVRKAKGSTRMTRIPRTKQSRKYNRQREPRRRGTPNLNDSVDYHWARINPFSMSLDWGVDEDNDMDSSSFKERPAEPTENPEPLLEPTPSDEDLMPDCGEVMADEQRPDSNNTSENNDVSSTQKDSEEESSAKDGS